MRLPEQTLRCIRQLEDRGFEAWVVGGCVRDALLGLEPQDYDLCTDALPEQVKEIFSHHTLVLAGEKHGTVTVITPRGPLEITTFRLEGDYRDSRHPGWVRFVEDIDLDLSRRDFTVNAMAYSPTRGLRDPFGGRRDLEAGILRAVGAPERRFTEDALRILRGCRFSARYRLTPEENTLRAMTNLAPLLDSLARERVFSELCKLLLWTREEELLLFAPILTRAIPELAPTLNFDQRSPHHTLDLYRHTARVVAAMPPDPALRWAALLHDVAKPAAFTPDEQGVGHFHGHASLGAEMADRILLGLKAPTALRRQAVTLIRQHMTPLEPEEKLLLRRLSRLGREDLFALLALQRADRLATAHPDTDSLDRARLLLEELLARQACFSLKDLAVNGRDLLAAGFPPGKELGQCLNRLLELVLEQRLPNQKEDLLKQALEMRGSL